MTTCRFMIIFNVIFFDGKCKFDCASEVTLLYYSNYRNFCASIQSGEICVALALCTYVYPVLSLSLFPHTLTGECRVRSCLPNTRARSCQLALGLPFGFFLRFTDVEHNTYVNVYVVEQLFGKRSIILRNNDFKYIRIK